MKATLTAPVADPSADPRFEELQFAISQALSATGASTSVWETIVQTAQALLTTSPDFRVAGYLAVAETQLRKVDGFIDGCGGYLDLLEKQWSRATPPVDKPKARVRAIAWWLERCAISLRAFVDLPFPHEATDHLLARCRKVDQLLGKELDDAPSMATLIQGLERAVQISDAVPETLHAVPSTRAPAIAETQITSDAEAKSAVAQLRSVASCLAGYWQSLKVSDPRVYRTHRFAYWFTVDEMPPVENGRTAIPAPEGALIDRLASLRQNQQWPALLEFAENTAFQRIFWFDLQRAAAEALEAIADADVAAEEVHRETRRFVARHPGIDKLCFANGMAFADAETLAWLSTDDAAPTAVVPVAPHDLEITLTQDIDQIKPLIKQRKWVEAAEVFQKRLQAALSGRERFLCRVAFAGALAKSSPTWFAPQAEQIIDDIDTFRLDDFDPALALKGMTVALKGYRASSDSNFKRRADELLQRLAQLDLTEFVRQGGVH